MDLLDHHVRLNLAGYMMDRTGTQTDFDNVDTNPASPTFNLHTEETRNAPGTSKIRGIEADLTAKVAEGLTLGASYAYTYTFIPATANPFLNNVLYQVYTVYTPRNSASVSADYSVPVGGEGSEVKVHLDANYASSQYSFQNEAVKADASFVVNGRIALADIEAANTGAKVTIAIWARNLFNEEHLFYKSGSAQAGVSGEQSCVNALPAFCRGASAPADPPAALFHPDHHAGDAQHRHHRPDQAGADAPCHAADMGGGDGLDP
ncbi:hypothetical protein E4T56_gene6466, partial [Termitomyces sp. T112]